MECLSNDNVSLCVSDCFPDCVMIANKSVRFSDSPIISYYKGQPVVRRYGFGADWNDEIQPKIKKTPAVRDYVRVRMLRVAAKLRRFNRWCFYENERELSKQKAADNLYDECLLSLGSLFDISFQGGKKKEARIKRDALQRIAAEKREENERKKVPKKDRELEIKQQRDKRCPVLQSGAVLRTALTFGAGVLATKLWRTISKAETALDSVNSVFSQLSKIAKGLKEHLGSVLWNIPLIMTVFFAIRQTTGGSNVLLSVVVTALAKVVGHKLWSHISKFFPGGNGETLEQQAGFSDFASVAPKLMSILFTFSVLKRVRPSTVTEFCKRISMLERMTGGWEVFLKWVLCSLETLVNFARRMFGKERVTFFRDAHKPTYEWAKRVDSVCLREATGGDLTPKELDEMVELVQQGFAYKELYRNTKMDKFVNDYVARISAALMPYQGALNSKNNFRFEPATLMIYGKPGIGKTLMAMHVCAAVMLESGIVSEGATYSDVIKQVWQKGNSEYWNGYAGQACLVMDDAFQARANATDKENDYMSIIRMVSTWSFPLNFADLASKGKIYFNSKFIFGTTNMASIDSEAKIVIQEPEAVARRLTFPYFLRVKSEYVSPTLGSGKLDFDKFQVECEKCSSSTNPLDAFPWYVWEAAKHNFVTGQTSPTFVSLKEVIREVSVDLKRRLDTYKSSQERLESFIGRYRKPVDSNEAVFQAGMKLEKDKLLLESSGHLIDHVLSDRPYMEILGVDADATEADIKAAYRRLSKEVHPDKHPNRVRAAEAMKKLNLIADELIAARAERRKFCSELEENVRELSTLHKIVKVTLGFFGGLLVAVFAIKAVKALLCFCWSLLEGIFGKKKREKKSQQSNRVLTPRTQKVGMKDPIFQSIDTSIATNIYANSYKMFATMLDGSELVVGQVQFVEGSLAVQPEHFTNMFKQMRSDKELSDDSLIYLRNAVNHEHQLSFSLAHYLDLKRYVFKDADVEFIDFGQVRSHRNITNNFMLESDLKYVNGNRARLDICEVDYNKRIVNVNNRKIYVVNSIKVGTDVYAGGKRIKKYIVYDAPTTVGDCGAPLCILDNNSYSGRTYMGMHVAGQSLHQVGYAAVVTKEMVEEAIKHLKVIRDAFEEDLSSRGITLQAGNSLPFANSGSFLPIGTVTTPINLCPKSQYYVTPLYGSFGEYPYFPAHLSPVTIDGVKHFPMENAVAPYATPVRIFEQKWLKQALHVSMLPFTKLTKDYSRRLYSFEEAVLGVPEEKFRSIPRGTAAGFPYVYDVRNGKKEFFGTDVNYDLDNDKAKDLKKRVEYILDSAAKGVRLSHVFVDFLKDELRSPEKNKVAATRLISSAPLDYTIAWRMMFGAFSSAAMRTHTRSGMAPGICAYTDWDILVERLRIHGKKCFDGDFKAFDSSEQPTVHDLILEYINRWYNDGESNALIRKVLWLDMVHSRHIGGRGGDQRYIYQWNKSLPSGHPFTTIVNSIYALFCLVSAYIVCTKDNTGFWNHVSSVTYGDDNVSNVDEGTSHVFNQKTVAEALMSEFGMKYTPGDKSGDYRDTFDIEELTFLKRGFSLQDGRWLCPLELNSFLYTCYWCKNHRLEKEIINDVLEGALLELSMHPQRSWDEYAPRIVELLEKRVGYTKCIPDKTQYLNEVLSRTDNWY